MLRTSVASALRTVAGPAVLALLIAAPTVGCTSSSPAAPGGSPPATVADNREVTVTGPVTDALAPNIVLVGDPGPEVILVVIPEGNPPLRPGQQVEVSGEVVAFQVDTMSGGAAFDGAGLGSWDGEPCLLASRVRMVEAR